MNKATFDKSPSRFHNNSRYYIESLFPDFMEFSGDRLYGDDSAIIGGITSFDGFPVTVIGQLQGGTLSERMECNFSMSKPEGYRKALRLMKQAEKFCRPIICFIDTIGAFPGKESEDRGIGYAIAHCIMECTHLKTPIISVLIGFAGSGGALALCVADTLIAFEHSTMCVASPKACANILKSNSPITLESANHISVQAQKLQELGIVDLVLKESTDDVLDHSDERIKLLHHALKQALQNLSKKPMRQLIRQRNKKYNDLGKQYIYSR